MQTAWPTSGPLQGGGDTWLNGQNVEHKMSMANDDKMTDMADRTLSKRQKVSTTFS